MVSQKKTSGRRPSRRSRRSGRRMQERRARHLERQASLAIPTRREAHEHVGLDPIGGFHVHLQPPTSTDNAVTATNSPFCEPPNYAPLCDPTLARDAYSPIHVSSDDEINSIPTDEAARDWIELIDISDDEEIPPIEGRVPPTQSEVGQETPGRSVTPLPPDCAKGFYYIPVPGDSPDGKPIIMVSDPVVAELLSSSTIHEWGFAPPQSTVTITEL